MKLIEYWLICFVMIWACVGIVFAVGMIWASLVCLWEGFKQRRELKRPLNHEYWGDE